MIDNPYNPPATDANQTLPATHRSPLRFRRHVLRNLAVWSVFLVIWCVIDYSYVHRGPKTVSGASTLFLPAYYFGIVFANRGLFPNFTDLIRRWIAIAVVSLLLASVSGYCLFILGLLFHLEIGGSL